MASNTQVRIRTHGDWCTASVLDGMALYYVEFRDGSWWCDCGTSKSCRHIVATAVEWDRRVPGVLQ
jgi:hypothetical protein